MKDRPETVFGELAIPLIDQLYNFAHWLTQDRSESEDLVQESLMKGLRSFSSFQQGTNFRAWMFRILRNTYLSSRSGSSRNTVPLDEESDAAVPAGPETPETILLEAFQTDAVRQAIRDLPVHFRETLLLCDVEEMSYAEIAETLSMPIGTVMSRLARARKLLRESLRTRIGER